MSVYPRSLSHYLNRLSGYNKNNVKLNVLGSTSASQGDIIQVDLPTNSIVDLSSLAWSLQCSFAEQPEGTVGWRSQTTWRRSSIVLRSKSTDKV